MYKLYIQSLATHTPACSCAHCLTYMHAHMHTCTLILTQQRHAYRFAHMGTHKHIYTHTQTHKCAHTQAFTHRQAQTQTLMQTYTYTHTCTFICGTPIHQLFLKKIFIYFLVQHIKAQISQSLCLTVFKSTCNHQVTAYKYQETAK